MKIASFFSNSAGILTSRLFGFVRDLMMASILGSNIYSDIFFVAFKLPNLFRRIFGEGAFAQSFLPSFVASKHKSIFSVTILIELLSTVLALSLVVVFFSREIALLMAPGFDADAIDKTAIYLAIQFWYLPLIFVVTFLASLLQYKEHFATTAFSTALLNISLITALFLYRGESGEDILTALSYAVVAGGIMQVIAHLIMARRLGTIRMLSKGFCALSTHYRKTKEESTLFFKNFFPAIWGNSTAQIMAFLDTWLASFLVTGSISYLYYANRIFQLPLALFAIALSTAIFPSIAKAIGRGDEDGAVRQMKRGFWILAFLLGMAAIGGAILSREIIWLLFERGAFGRSDTIQSASVLRMYMIGLLPFGLSKLFSLWLYSNHRQSKAARIATWSLAGYALTALSLFSQMGASGLALANTVAGFTSFTLLAYSFGRENLMKIFDRKRVISYIVAMTLYTIALYMAQSLISEYTGV